MKNTLRACLLSTVALLVLVSATSAQSFSVSLDSRIADEPVTGRLLLLLSRTKSFRPGENGTPIFGVDVNDLAPGTSALVETSVLGQPVTSLADIPVGDYFAKAYLHVYTTFHRADGYTVLLPMDRGEGQSWQRAPGNLFSARTSVHFDPASQEPIKLLLDQKIPPIEARPDTDWVKHVRIQSPLLTEFWGQPMFVGATVLLPRGFADEPEARYPIVFTQGHFSSGSPMGFGRGRDFDRFWKSNEAAKALIVTIQHANPYYDDSYGVNSANIGPYGDALVYELIPEIESRFRGLGTPEGRLLTGGSTGGWIALAMQVFYPDFFGGCWSFYPDQLDFRNYQVVNLMKDDNAYFVEHEWSRVARPGKRQTDGNIDYTMSQENLYEEVIGTRYRSGDQWAAWNAVFAPVADDGYPQPLWDPLTGKIDHAVAEAAREKYDLRYVLERDWATLGPKLADKLHVYVGRIDDYYLEGGVYRLEEFLSKTDSPAFEGTFEYGERGGHGWSPFRGNELLKVMLNQAASAPLALDND